MMNLGKPVRDPDDLPADSRDRLWAVVDRASHQGVQLTPMQFRATASGTLTIDGMDPVEWLDALTSD